MNECVETWDFPLDADVDGVSLRWRRDILYANKLKLYRIAMATFRNYEAKASLCKRPEEVDQEWLYTPVWERVNEHYAHLNINAHSHQELIEQFGILRYGHRPRIGDTFSGGGSIPFEAARLGCDVYASDLNPIAYMLTWGALNIVGASQQQLDKIEKVQFKVANALDEEIINLGIEHDIDGNRAKTYLYCLETLCPETNWLLPLSPSWIISRPKKVVAKLIPNHVHKRFDIQVIENATTEELYEAERGTIRDNALVYELDGKTYRTPIKTLRGDYKDADGNTKNKLRLWEKADFIPRADDIFQERLYAIHWITKDSIDSSRQETFFSAVTEDDLLREEIVNGIVEKNISSWQESGLIPDMTIEPGEKTNELIRTRGWTYWHHLFNPRHLLLNAILKKHLPKKFNNYFNIIFCRILNVESKISRWSIDQVLARDVFYNMALNTFYNYGSRASISAFRDFNKKIFSVTNNPNTIKILRNHSAEKVDEENDLYITDPPYADAVHYHEITEYFIAWLRKSHHKPFSNCIWDSCRALAIKGSGDDFRRDMIDAYSAMARFMPENGLQCVMFTHQDIGVWSDLIGIFWASGHQVVAAWYIATETSSELKKGGYVQGTVILILRKRAAGERLGFKHRILPAVRNEVKHHVETMMHLNNQVECKLGEPVFNDSDLQMAGYASALKILTSFTKIGGENVNSFAYRPRLGGEITVVDEIVQQAAEAANSLLVPEGLSSDTWYKINGIQRFYLRMMDMESTGVSKLDNYQNFAKAFHVQDYTKVMANITANRAQLKQVTDFAPRDLTENTEIGGTLLGQLIIGLQQLLAETEPQAVIGQLQADLPNFMEVRHLLIDILGFYHKIAPEIEVREVAQVLGDRLSNMRALDQ